MIAVSNRGQSFRALADYLVNGRTGEEQGRVAWTSSRNLPTSEPELAATMMRATAAQNVRTEFPVYHVAVSFDPGDRVEQASMERVADRLLAELKLDARQAVIVAHQDRQHPHLHIMVNRVHPETGKAWDRWQDYPTIQRVLREEERALAVREVPGTLYQLPGQSAPERATTTRVEEQRTMNRTETRTIQQPPATEIRVPVAPADVERLASLRDDLATYEYVLAVGRTQSAARTALDAAHARVDQLSAAASRAERASLAFHGALRHAYQDPGRAHDAFLDLAKRAGVREAASAMAEHPERFGTLYAEEKRRLGGLLRTHDDSIARRYAHEAAPLGRAAHEARDQLDHAMTAARERRLADGFAREFAHAYREPHAAHLKYNELSAERGPSHAAKTLARNPEQFGELKALDGRDSSEAHAHTKRAAAIGRESSVVWDRSRASARALNPRTELEAATAEKHRADAWVKTLRMESDRLPQRGILERRISIAMSALAPRELNQLRALANGPQFALASELRVRVRDFLLGRDQGVER